MGEGEKTLPVHARLPNALALPLAVVGALDVVQRTLGVCGDEDKMDHKMQDVLVKRCAEVEGECNKACNKCPLGKLFAEGAAWARKSIADTLDLEFALDKDIIEFIRSGREEA